MIYSELKSILGVKTIQFGQLPSKADPKVLTAPLATVNGITLFLTKKTQPKDLTANTPVTKIGDKWFIGVVESKMVNIFEA